MEGAGGGRLSWLIHMGLAGGMRMDKSPIFYPFGVRVGIKYEMLHMSKFRTESFPLSEISVHTIFYEVGLTPHIRISIQALYPELSSSP